jgi:hypothetical protein
MDRSVNASDTGELLELWERGAATAPVERDDALLSVAHDPLPVSLGARNAALLRLRSRFFGPAQPLRCDCPACGVASDFTVDCDALSRALLPAPGAIQPQRLDAAGWRVEFRVPDAADLRAAARRSGDEASFVHALLQRCVSSCECAGTQRPPHELPAPVAEALSRRMEELEPGATVSFDLACPECRHAWSASMDVGAVLWSEIELGAERMLLDVDALARAYGWSEAQVLGLSPTRRAAYMQLVGAG